jgi:hypothetical protein
MFSKQVAVLLQEITLEYGVLATLPGELSRHTSRGMTSSRGRIRNESFDAQNPRCLIPPSLSLALASQPYSPPSYSAPLPLSNPIPYPHQLSPPPSPSRQQ